VHVWTCRVHAVIRTIEHYRLGMNVVTVEEKRGEFKSRINFNQNSTSSASGDEKGNGLINLVSTKLVERSAIDTKLKR
jgi:hypothetical protein